MGDRRKYNKTKIENDLVLMKVELRKAGKIIEIFEVKYDAKDFDIVNQYYWKMAVGSMSVVTSYRKNNKSVSMVLQNVLAGARWVQFLDKDRLNFCRKNIQIVDRRIGVRQATNRYEINSDGTVTFWVKGGYTFLIDEDDLELVKSYLWHINLKRGGYFMAKVPGSRENLYLHRLIMNASPEDAVDHKHHLPADNRKAELRKCTNSQNSHNTKGLRSTNTSGVTGVQRNNKSWSAILEIEGEILHKTFPTFAQAVAQRKQWEDQYNPSGLKDKL
jgi:hypothetical protein